MNVPNLRRFEIDTSSGQPVTETKMKTGEGSEKADFKETNNTKEYKTTKTVNKSDIGGLTEY